MFHSLTEAQLRRHMDNKLGIFIAESPKVINVALNAGYEPVAMLCEDRHITGDAADIIARCGDIPVYTGSRQLLAEITGYTLTRGVLCAMRRREAPKVEDVCRGASRVVVVDNVVEATNIGSIFRSAAALGIDAVLLTSNSCDPLTRRAVRVSMGSVFLVPWTWLKEPVQWLNTLGFKTVAMALTDKSVSISDPVPPLSRALPSSWAPRATACLTTPLPMPIMWHAYPCLTMSIRSMWLPPLPWPFGS